MQRLWGDESDEYKKKMQAAKEKALKFQLGISSNFTGGAFKAIAMRGYGFEADHVTGSSVDSWYEPTREEMTLIGCRDRITFQSILDNAYKAAVAWKGGLARSASDKPQTTRDRKKNHAVNRAIHDRLAYLKVL